MLCRARGCTTAHRANGTKPMREEGNLSEAEEGLVVSLKVMEIEIAEMQTVLDVIMPVKFALPIKRCGQSDRYIESCK